MVRSCEVNERTVDSATRIAIEGLHGRFNKPGIGNGGVAKYGRLPRSLFRGFSAKLGRFRGTAFHFSCRRVKRAAGLKAPASAMGLYYTVLQLLAIPPALVASLFGTLFVSLLDGAVNLRDAPFTTALHSFVGSSRLEGERGCRFLPSQFSGGESCHKSRGSSSSRGPPWAWARDWP